MKSTNRRIRLLGLLAVVSVAVTVVSVGASARGDTFLVSVASDSTQADQNSADAVLSGDGNLVAFKSRADNLVPGDTNNADDIFVRNRTTGQTVRVSLAPSGAEFTANSLEPFLSLDGNAVAWSTGGTIYWRALDANGAPAGPSVLVSHDTSGDPVGGSQEPAMTSDGSIVVYWSHSGAITPGVDAGGTPDVFAWTRASDSTEVVSVGTSGAKATPGAASYLPSISGDGRYVVFESQNAFDPTDTNGKFDIYLRDRTLGTTTLVTRGYDGNQTDRDSLEGNGGPVISSDGSTVAFASDATNLVPNDTNNNTDVFVWHRATARTERVSVWSDGTQAQGDSATPSLNNDGTVVAFQSAARLHDWDTNSDSDVYVRQLAASPPTTKLQSLSYNGQSVTGDSFRPALNGDGKLVTFHSASTKLVAADTNNRFDVFVHELGVADTTPPNVSGTPTTAANANGWYSGNVTVQWTATDPQPSAGQPAALAPTIVTTEGKDQTITSPVAYDGNGNPATGTVKLSIDKTAPGVAVTVNNAKPSGWYNSDVVVGFTCSDALSGIATCPAAIHLTTEGAGQSVPAAQRTATDRAGNSTTASLAAINIDLTPPVVQFSGPTTYDADSTVAITCSASDALSGIATATCPTIGGPAYLFAPGTNTVNATATDKAGNDASASYTFTITPTTGGLRRLACSFFGTGKRYDQFCKKLTRDLDDAIAYGQAGDTKHRDLAIRKFLGTASKEVGNLITTQQMTILTRVATSITG